VSWVLFPEAVSMGPWEPSLSFLVTFFFFFLAVRGNDTTEQPAASLRTRAGPLDAVLEIAGDFPMAEQELDEMLDSTALEAGFLLLLPLFLSDFVNGRHMAIRSLHNLQASGNSTISKTYTLLASCFGIRIVVFIHTT
jgi:hypothetical protein